MGKSQPLQKIKSLTKLWYISHSVLYYILLEKNSNGSL